MESHSKRFTIGAPALLWSFVYVEGREGGSIERPFAKVREDKGEKGVCMR